MKFTNKRIKPILNSAVVDDTQIIRFKFQGRVLEGLQGDSLASALMANDIQILAKSYKYARPRGLMAPYADEPNGLVGLEENGVYTPNAKATQIEIYKNLSATSISLQSGGSNMVKSWFKVFHKFMPAGFYYKTFMRPQSLWMFYEQILRKFAGVSKSPTNNDSEHYDHKYHHCDVLIVGSGLAGITAALEIAPDGKRIIMVDDHPMIGGSIYEYPDEVIGNQTQLSFLKSAKDKLATFDNVCILTRTTAFAFHDYNLVIANELRQDHIPLCKRDSKISRQRLHKIRAEHVILATGAGERPMAFNNNDLPGVMLSTLALSLLHRYSVLVGENIAVFSNNDAGVNTAIALAKYAKQVTLIDVRPELSSAQIEKMKEYHITYHTGSVVLEASGKKAVQQIDISKYTADTQLSNLTQKIQIPVDALVVAGGFNPLVHLDCHTGSNPHWSHEVVGFLPKLTKPKRSGVGALLGYFLANEVVENAKQTAKNYLLGEPKSTESKNNSLNTMAFFHVRNKQGKQFVDLQNDVTSHDIELAIRENYKCIEHVKRYTALGFGTDQGKTSNVLGVAIAAACQNLSMDEVGTTTFRPAYTPIAFGALAGLQVHDLFDPKRYTPMHQSHLNNKAEWETVGQWMRPWYFPMPKEVLDKAVYRESLAVRKSLGMMDASTLGKIDIQGKDSREFLSRIYTNAWAKLPVGSCRYGLMLDENGMIMDDGVTACITDNHFIITTTTGGAARVYEWLEVWLQTEWPDLEVFVTSITDHYSTTAVVGPKSRHLMQLICQDIDFDNNTFPFMTWREGLVLGVPARIMRISFSGELAYEINVQSNYGRYIWDKVKALGKPWNITVYGTESMHVLRAEKGYIIAGQDTDGSVSPYDADLAWAVANKKKFSFLGKRSLSRSDTARTDRKQMIGLLTEDSKTLIPEGAQLLESPKKNDSLGHVTSSYFSPILGRSIAMGLVRNGINRKDEFVYALCAKGKPIKAKISSYIFYDPRGEKVNGEDA